MRRKREGRRRALLESALALVESEGLAALTLQALADREDYAVAALYRYFPSKDALIADLQRRVVELIVEDVGVALERFTPATRENALDRVLATVRTYDRFAAEHPAHFGLLSASLADPRLLLDDASALAVLAAVRPVLDALDSDLAAICAPSRRGEPGSRSLLLWSALNGVLQIKKLSRLRRDVQFEKLATEVIRTMLIGWGVAEKTVEQGIAGAERMSKRKRT